MSPMKKEIPIVKYFGIVLAIISFNSCSEPAGHNSYVPAASSIVDKQFNFHVVSPGVWRSAQPNSEALIRMKNHGLKTMINLRGDTQTDKWERSITDSLCLNYYNFPLDARKEQSADTIEKILAIMYDPGQQPVLIHCLGGKDRTGMLAAIYQIRYMGARFEDAHREMLMYGYHEKDYPEAIQTVKRLTMPLNSLIY